MSTSPPTPPPPSFSRLMADAAAAATNPLAAAKHTEFDYLYPRLESYFLSWYLPLVMTVGLVGGLVCLGFILCTQIFPRNLVPWLVALTLADVGILLFDCLRLVIKILSQMEWDIRDVNTFLCRSHLFLSNYFLYLSAWMQVCVSIQRLYSVCYPIKARLTLRPHRVWTFLLVVCCFLVLPHLPYLLYWHVNPSNQDCEPVQKWWYYVTSLFDVIVLGVAPLLLMTISTLGIARVVLQWRLPNCFSARCGCGCAAAGVHCYCCESSSALEMLGEIPNPGRSRRRLQEAKSNQPHQVSKVLLLINVFYMLTTYPYIIYLIVLNFVLQDASNAQEVANIDKGMQKFIYYTLRVLCYLNSAFNWLLYYASGDLFRQKVRQTLSGHWGKWRSDVSRNT